MRKTIIIKAIATVAIAAIAFTGCSNESNDDTADVTQDFATDAELEPSIIIEDAWARATPTESMMGAAYMNITSSVDDALIAVSVDISVAMMTQVHESTTASDGSMGMQAVGSLPLLAGVKTELKPGGYHIMLMKLSKPLEVGQAIAITLTFESGATQVVEVPVLEQAP